MTKIIPSVSPPSAFPLDATIVIAGADLIGGALACALAQAGLSVVVVDGDSRAGPTRDGRVCTISPPSRHLLEAIGVWADVAEDAGEIRDVRVVEGDSPLLFHLACPDSDDEPLGWVVENWVMRRAIVRRLAHLPTATRLASARVETLRRDAARAHLTLSDGRVLSAQLVVAADGCDSPLRAQAGIDVTRWDLDQSTIMCVVEHEHPHEGIACKRLLPTGPFTILPMAGNRSAVVWSEQTRLAPAIMNLSDDVFLAELTRRFGDVLGVLRVVGPRHVESPSSRLANVCVGQRLALVGDAAHAMPPVLGQEINMGLRDVGALTETLVEAARLGFDVGDASVLARFQRWRRAGNTVTVLLNDGLARVFATDAAPIRIVRDVGLAVVNRIGPLKTLVLRHATGAAGDLPKLMRGETP